MVIRIFLATFVLGLLVTLLAARLYPLPDVKRMGTDAVALANGGREEIFEIRLPDDRLGSPRAAAVAPFPEAAFSRNGRDQILAELFRVRNKDGRIVGLASKLSGKVAYGSQLARDNVDWMLMIPGRGALLMSTQGMPADTEKSYPFDYLGLDPVSSGRILEGTWEFDDLTGFYLEETEASGIDENGQPVGLLRLRTRMQGEI
ncbi:MAG: hypothetical protein ACR2QG_12745 [Gammaproteobacteria bacterium]